MPAILPPLAFSHSSLLARCFTPYQIHWILAEDILHARKKQAFALAEKSVRIGWTFCDGFKNVRKRLRYSKRDYLFATKDFPNAIEYISGCHKVAELFNLTRYIISHGEQFHKVPRLDQHGRPTAFTDELRMGVIKFDNGSRIMAFSSHPQAMAVYAGDIGLDEFAKHQNAKLLWETAQGRVTWGYDIAVWSSHDGEDTLFHEFALEARSSANDNLALALGKDALHSVPAQSPIEIQNGKDAFHSVPDQSSVKFRAISLSRRRKTKKKKTGKWVRCAINRPP